MLDVKPMLKDPQVTRALLLFAGALGLHKAVEFFNADSSLDWLQALSSVAIFCLAIFAMRIETSDLSKYGLLIPKKFNRFLSVSLFLGVLYVLLIIFIPGGISGFELFPSPPFDVNLLFTTGAILIASVAVETTLRGYVQTRFTNAYGFPIALVVVSVMFILYTVPAPTYFDANLNSVVNQFAPLLAEGIFVCFLFKETKTVICPIAFSTTVTLLRTLTPLQPLTAEYTTLVSVAAYILFVPIIQGFTEEVNAEESRLDESPILDSE